MTITEALALVPEDRKSLRAALKLVHDTFPDSWERIGTPLIERSIAKDDDQARDDIFKYVVGAKAIQDVMGVDADTAEKLILGKNEGGMNFSDVKPATPKGVLAGGRTIQVRGGDGTMRFYQVYEFPPGSGSWVSYQFNSEAQAKQVLGANFPRTTYTEDRYNQLAIVEGQAEEIAGQKGSFGNMMEQIMVDAARQAGARDPSLIGKMASDREMQRIMAQAIVGDWTAEEIRAAQRGTKFWQETLYPGIKAFYGRTDAPEQAWKNYNDNVTPALTSLGYARDGDGTYNTQIKKMLDRGVDAQTFLENVPVFMQAQQNEDFYKVLNQRSQRELGKSVSFGDWFSLLKGEGADEVRKVAEGAVVAYQAQQAKLGLGEDMLQRLIRERDLSEAEARNIFSEVNQAVLALGESGLRRGDLSRDDVLSAAAGINPDSGLSQDEVRLKVAKLARENALFDDEKVNFYVGYSPAGTPMRPGLSPLTPEGA